MKNAYMESSKLSEGKFREIVRCFCVGIEASKVAQLAKVNRSTVNAIYLLLRIRIAEICEQTAVQLPSGVVCELDESYFGPRRQHGKRGRGASGKIPVFGILARGGCVPTHIVPNCSSAVILPIIRRFVPIQSVINTDGFGAYDRLALMGYKHRRVKHGEGEYARPGGNHINGIENFWGICKARLSRFRGLRPGMFYYHLKECEFRYNMRHADIYRFLLKNLRNPNPTSTLVLNQKKPYLHLSGICLRDAYRMRSHSVAPPHCEPNRIRAGCVRMSELCNV